MIKPDIDAYLQCCRGKKISRVWKGYGSALFLELGRLHRESYMVRGKKRYLISGHITIQVDFDWRVEKRRSILVGSSDTERRIESQIQLLKGKKIQDVSLTDRLPELDLCLSDCLWLRTFTIFKGQPEWAIRFEDNMWMHVRRGHVVIENLKDKGQQKN